MYAAFRAAAQGDGDARSGDTATEVDVLESEAQIEATSQAHAGIEYRSRLVTPR
jgi:hypothetical protein